MGAFDRTVPDVHLHIGDERRSRGGGGVHQHVYPATGEVQGPVPLAGADDVDEAVQAAQRRVRDLADVDAVAAPGRARPPRRSARRGEGRAGPPVGARQRHDLRHRPLHGDVGGRLRPLLRRLGGQGRGSGHLVAGPRSRARVHGARALRRRRDHHHLERPARLGRDEGDAGPRRREHGGGQAVRADALRDGALHGARARGRDPAGRGQRAPRDRRGRRGARPPPAGAEDQLHRRSDGRPQDPRHVRRDAEAGRARAGRQVGEPRVPRRRPRRGRVHRHRLGAPDPRRPGLRPRHPAASCTTASTTSWPRRSSPSPATSRSATRSIPRSAWVRW